MVPAHPTTGCGGRTKGLLVALGVLSLIVIAMSLEPTAAGRPSSLAVRVPMSGTRPAETISTYYARLPEQNRVFESVVSRPAAQHASGVAAQQVRAIPHPYT